MSKELTEYLKLKYKIDLQQINDDGENFWRAAVPILPGLEVFEDTPELALTSLEDAKAEWIATALKRKISIPVPTEDTDYSGRITLRVSKGLHGALVEKAREENVTLNSLLNETIQIGLAYKSVSNAVMSSFKDNVANLYWNISGRKSDPGNIRKTVEIYAPKIEHSESNSAKSVLDAKYAKVDSMKSLITN